MKILINNADVRKYRQLGKQLNSDNFNGRVREIQENQLTELLGDAFAYDFFNFLQSGWTGTNETFTRDSEFQMTATDVDLSALYGNSLRINSDIFVIVETATFDGIDTIIVVSGYELPTTITSVEFRTETDYTYLLNGDVYSCDGKTVSYAGLRPFLVWHFLTNYTNDGDIKHSDVGNIGITGDLFQHSSYKERQNAASGYLQNATREENRIIQYLNNKSFEFWETKPKGNLIRFDFVISD